MADLLPFGRCDMDPNEHFDDYEGYYDYYVFVMTCAPDFPKEDYLEDDAQLGIDDAFDLLRYGLRYVKRLSDVDREAAEAAFRNAYDAFARGDKIEGRRALHVYGKHLFGADAVFGA